MVANASNEPAGLVPPPDQSRLRKGEVGVWGAIAEEIAAMAPACDTVAFITSAAAFAFFFDSTRFPDCNINNVS